MIESFQGVNPKFLQNILAPLKKQPVIKVEDGDDPEDSDSDGEKSNGKGSRLQS